MRSNETDKKTIEHAIHLAHASSLFLEFALLERIFMPILILILI